MLRSSPSPGNPPASPGLVLPADAPSAVSPGPDSDRVLLVGSGPVAGIGVASHQEGLTGALARQLSEHSGRGAMVEAIGRVGVRLEEVPRLLAGTRPERFDAIVVTAGMVEAFGLTSRSAWRRSLESVLEAVHAQQPRGSEVVVTGMPAPTSTDRVHGWRGWRIDRHATALNRVSRATIAAHRYGHFAQLAPAPHVGGQPTSDCYTAWAGQICAVLEPLLTGTARPREAGPAVPHAH